MSKANDFSQLTQALLDKMLTKEELLKKVQQDFSLIDFLVQGVGHSKAAVRYGCSNVLLALGEQNPEKLYPHFDFFVNLLDNKHRILTWNALAIIANLTRVDVDKKFDAVFDTYYGYLGNEYMVTVANVVGNSATIALAKPYLTTRIVDELLKIDNLSVTPHLTEECKRVIAQAAIKSFDQFFDQVEQKEKVLSFVKRHENSSRKKLKTAAEKFLKKWN
ncbi:MAG: hypothetical protein NWF03_08345 [Candidatus Bathyarchaeota archaeon]|nr:hypothetical protein [Candidatus Bathyarchaeota archaeon]